MWDAFQNVHRKSRHHAFTQAIGIVNVGHFSKRPYRAERYMHRISGFTIFRTNPQQCILQPPFYVN